MFVTYRAQVSVLEDLSAAIQNSNEEKSEQVE